MHLMFGRKILKLREVFKPHLKHVIGDCSSVFPRHDDWHPIGPLVIYIPARIVYDSALPFQAKVQDVIQDSAWHWPPARSDNLVRI